MSTQRAILGAVVTAAVVLTLWLTGSGTASAQDDVLDRGRELYLVGCVSCHGSDGGGVEAAGEQRGPSLLDAGEASAFYVLSTGRMPLGNPNEQARHKDPAYPPDEQAALVAYVASLGDGPALPTVDLTDPDLAAGGLTYRENCQACHSASGGGGALSYGDAAPPLNKAEPLEIAAAVRAGPGQMPVFGPVSIADEQLDDLIAYVEYLKAPEDPGGIPMGRIGPVPEGFAAWFVGVTLMLACVFWIGTRSPIRKSRE